MQLSGFAHRRTPQPPDNSTGRRTTPYLRCRGLLCAETPLAQQSGVAGGTAVCYTALETALA